MIENMRFRDRVVVVTGAARGIGFVTASIAAQESALVVVCDVEPAAVNAAVEKIGGATIGIVGDVSKLEQVRANVDEVMKVHGRIDVLVNNAAVTSYQPPETLTEEAWRRQIDVCLGGSFFWAQTVAVASMIPRREGSIVNVGSGAALAAMPRSAAYVSAKHGVVGLTKSLAVDWGQFNIRVNSVCPGLTYTELAKFVASKDPEMMKQRELRIPLQRGATPEDVANAILFLASPQSQSISGVALSVDGGTLAMSSGFSAPKDAICPSTLSPNGQPQRSYAV
jgi:NAD(P)-dependent dehydrogenase (short-subunit alcohol dehydrogenase family)